MRDRDQRSAGSRVRLLTDLERYLARWAEGPVAAKELMSGATTRGIRFRGDGPSRRTARSVALCRHELRARPAVRRPGNGRAGPLEQGVHASPRSRGERSHSAALWQRTRTRVSPNPRPASKHEATDARVLTVVTAVRSVNESISVARFELSTATTKGEVWAARRRRRAASPSIDDAPMQSRSITAHRRRSSRWLSRRPGLAPTSALTRSPLCTDGRVQAMFRRRRMFPFASPARDRSTSLMD